MGDGQSPVGRGHPEGGDGGHGRRGSVLLVLVGLVVLLGAGGTVVALMRGGGVSDTATVPDPAGLVPQGFLGEWEARADGAGTRRLTLGQGRVGERVLSLVVDDTHRHCAFAAELLRPPGGDGPLRVGAADVTSGTCTAGAPSVLTLLPDGRLKREDAGGAGKVIYERSGGKG
ncbi:hypothetical protein [Streptomyces sp. NPDC046860]|uniref:hypothetical protein n=1 Tax=Streptomyces sp. NPDC046860 TaxID=3154495 RepID=UPI0033E16CA8